MTIDMTRHSGDKNLPVVECTDSKLQKYRVRTDLRPDYDEETEEQRGVTFIETEFAYKPSMDEVKEFVYGVKNAQIDEQILTGYQWNGRSVWLSTENQFNYFGAFVIACLAAVFGWLGKAFFDNEFSMFPVVFKLGTNEEPHYETFNTMEELKPFCIGACNLTELDGAGSRSLRSSYTGFVKYVAAITRLVCGDAVPIGGIGGVEWVDAGCDPRSRNYGSDDASLRKQIATAIRRLRLDGFVLE